MFCKNCGKEIDDKEFVCFNCGVRVDDDFTKPISAQTVFCESCGKCIHPRAYVCVHCGGLTKYALASEKKDSRRTKAFVYAIVSLFFLVIGMIITSAIMSIIGLAVSINAGDGRSKRWNIVAISICAAVCGLVLMGYFSPAL